MIHHVEHLNIRVEVLDDDGEPYEGRVREFATIRGKSSAFVDFDGGGTGGWFLTSELKPETP